MSPQQNSRSLHRILCFDIGGSAVKGMLFDESGRALTQRVRIPTPSPSTPKAVLAVMRSISGAPEMKGKFDLISVGFPGVVKRGTTLSAANLSPSWKNFSLQESLEREFGVDVKVANDADVQSLLGERLLVGSEKSVGTRACRK